MKKTTHFCDIDGCKNDAFYIEQKMQVIFGTDQTEGRSVPNYFDTVTIDLCEQHMKTALSGKYITANGAQGSNTYYLKS